MTMHICLQGDGKANKPNPYPVLKRIEDAISTRQYIVLFTDVKEGVVVWNTPETQEHGYYKIGDYSDTWDEDLFNPIGSENMITFRNK